MPAAGANHAKKKIQHQTRRAPRVALRRGAKKKDSSVGAARRVRPRRRVASLEPGALGGLGEAAVVAGGHLFSQLEQHCLDAVVPAPVLEDGAAGRVDGARVLRDAVEVDFCDEFEQGRLARVRRAARERERVDAVLEYGVYRAQDGAVPVREGDVVRVLQAVRDAAVADAVLAAVEFLQEAEVAGNCGRVREGLWARRGGRRGGRGDEPSTAESGRARGRDIGSCARSGSERGR